MFRIACLAGVVLLCSTSSAAKATIIAVNALADESTLDGNCTLREALLAANSNSAVDACPAGSAASTDTVVLGPGTYNLSLGPRGDDLGARGDLDLNDDLVLRGASPTRTVIDARLVDRVIEVHAGVTARVEDLTLRGGDAGSGSGGGVRNSGNLTLRRVHVTGNRASGPGGGIRNDGVLTVADASLDQNMTADHGGGLDNHGTASVENTTVTGNDGGDLGGGLYVLSGRSLTVVHSTVSGNSAAAGEAIHVGGSLTLGNSIVVGNCSGSVTLSLGGNVESPGDTCGLGLSDFVAEVDAGLAPLEDNGGDTLTQALLPGSPAIDSGSTGACLARDQRGALRPVDGNGDLEPACDAGAFERLSAPPIFSDGVESGDTTRWN